MILGRVVGEVWATQQARRARRAQAARHRALPLVRAVARDRRTWSPSTPSARASAKTWSCAWAIRRAARSARRRCRSKRRCAPSSIASSSRDDRGARPLTFVGGEPPGARRRMIRGRVIGEVWATRKAPGLDGRRLLIVGVDGADRAMVAIDTLDAREGEDVHGLGRLGRAQRPLARPRQPRAPVRRGHQPHRRRGRLMFLAKVIGSVWSSVKWPELERHEASARAALLARRSRRRRRGRKACAHARRRRVRRRARRRRRRRRDHRLRPCRARRGLELLPDGAKPSIPIDAAVVAIVDRWAVNKQ